MTDKILLLGHEKEAGLKLVQTLVKLGLRPAADTWTEFNPRSYGRKRPRVIIANTDAKETPALREFTARVRKAWGEHYPIIAMGCGGKFSEVARLLDDGMSDYLTPSSPAELIGRKIAKCDGGRATAASSGGELAADVPEALQELFFDNDALVRLGDIADIYGGATPRRAWCRRMAPPDDNWRGVITSEAVDRFHVGRPAGYLLWSRFHLFRVPAPHEYSVPEKVLLSRAGPPLAAAVDRSRLPAGNDVYSIVPHENAGAGFLACILNSRLMDFYFNRLTGNADGRLRPEALRDAPFPRPNGRMVRGMNRLATLLSHFGPNPQSWIDRQSKDELWEEMEEAVFACYGAGDEARECLAALHF